MNIASVSGSDEEIRGRLRSYIGRHAEKKFDWDAFPSNRGFPELERAQMRYVGAGGSPKVGDGSTLDPRNFTVSLIHLPPGKYAALHAHEIEEAFLVLNGVLTVGWEREGEVVEVQLGPKDMILNAPVIPHGFRNEGVEPVLMSIMVGKGRPLPPVYHAHPKDTDPAIAAAFGATSGKVFRLSQESTNSFQQQMNARVVRYSQQRPTWDDAGIAHTVYVGAGGIEATHNRKELVTVPKGKAIRPYSRSVEDTYFMLSGCLTVGWETNGRIAEERLGPRDLVFNPAGQVHYFRNDGTADAEMFMVVGSAEAQVATFTAP